ncbi:PAS domain-containing protein [Fodinibius salsisoli]|uniref:histidine kinase n=1 Tax=Fodinibius salsisoli TaxID=2820877 RepID=A0ABT3PKT9_9BACT|nr:PAS domain-containing protein [Fodinibius salsisoli]MCW9706552.1 PAS domain-containing protein [Fodinibius salsisoli]
MAQTYYILLLEHEKNTLELIRSELNKLDVNKELTVVQSKEELIDQLKNNPPDLIISAYQLPSLTGMEALRMVRQQHPHLPFIFVSKYMGEAKAVDAMLEGASDFTTKKNIGRLGPAVLRELKNYAEYKQQREKLTESRSRYETLIQSVNGIVWECDAQSLTFQYLSPKSKDILGYTPEEWLSEPNFWQDHIHPDDREKTISFCKRHTDQGQDHTFEYRMITADDEVVWLRDYVTVIMKDGQPHRLHGLMVDISQEKKAEKKLQQSLKQYEIITKATSDTIFEWDRSSGEVTYNENLYRMFGYKPDQVGSQYKWWADKVHPADLPTLESRLDKALSTKQNRIQFEYRFQCADGSYRHVFSRTFIIRKNDGEAIRMIGTIQDISTFKKREQRSRKFQQVISSLATNRSLLGMNILDALSEVLKVSAQALKIQRVNIWLLEGDTIRCICSYEDGKINTMRGQRLTQEDYPKYFHYIRNQRVIASANPYDHEAHTELIDSYLKPNNIQAILDTSVHSYGSTQVIVCHETVGQGHKWLSDEIAFAGAITDQIAHLLAYQEKNEKEKKIRESLQEKETLLTEVHHRVKNNLAVISGMMQLQAYEQVAQEVKDKLFDSIARIQTMAGIHELLYSSKSFSNLRLDKNIQKLISDVSATFQVDDQVKFNFELEPITINVNQAIPCSLIINEVVTNALKHAFNGEEDGTIGVNLSEKNDTISLVIKDNGMGLPDDYENLIEQGSLGFQLIKTLTTQLEAESHFVSQGNGTQFSLHFERSDLPGIGSGLSKQT